jgi:Rod binding domain-containing protein
VSPVTGLGVDQALALVDGDEGRIAALRRTPADDATARVAAAREIQVTFLTQLLRAMRRTVPESDLLPRSPARTIYEGAFDRSVAEAMARDDPLGLVERLAGPAGPQDPPPNGRYSRGEPEP